MADTRTEQVMVMAYRIAAKQGIPMSQALHLAESLVPTPQSFLKVARA